MGRRREPLILQRTADVLSSFECRLSGNEAVRPEPQALLLQAGLLHPSSDLNHLRARYTDLDEANIVGLSVATLKRLALCSGSWVMVRHVLTEVGRPAKIVALDPPHMAIEDCQGHEDAAYEDTENWLCFLPTVTLPSIKFSTLRGDVAYLSTMLAFNLGLHITWLHQWLSCHCSDKSQKLCLEASLLADSKVDVYPLWKLVPPRSNCFLESVAEENVPIKEAPLKHAFHVRVGHVKVPASEFTEFHTEDLQDVLQNYFKRSRVLARGDLFSVRVLVNGKKDQRLFNNTSEERIVYFKVIAMEPEMEPFLLVDCNQSALALVDSVPSRVPPSLMTGTSSRRPVAYMTPTIDQLARVLAPPLFTTPSLPLKTAVLLIGPAGCGKRTMVEFAAEAIGMHVVEYNCYELLGPTDGKTAAALSEAFEVARRYAPAVLLLRRFRALGKNTNPGSLSDGAGAVSRVVTVLEEAISQNLKAALNEADGLSTENGVLSHDHFRLHFKEHRPGLVLVVAAAESTEGMPPLLRRSFTHEFKLQPPDEQQRSHLLHQFLHLSNQCTDALLQEKSGGKARNQTIKECQLERMAKNIASQTAGTVPRDLQAIAADAGACMLAKKIEHFDEETCSSLQEDPEGQQNCEIQKEEDENVVELSAAVVEKAFERFKSRMASELGAPKVPNVKWEDVGGLEDVKKAILDTVQLPLLHRDLFASGLRQRSGVLLYGPPGTGKTLLAKAVATECSLKFLSVKGPELINMYIGESEKNVREIFQKARSARPCVIFFDELDALAPARGASGDSGGVMDRVVSQMLAEIDGLNEGQQDLFIIGASNRPDLIDPALLRPGRFDKLLYVGISTDVSYRQRVLEALTRKFQLDQDVSLMDVAQVCPVTFTGADLYALCADAWMLAVKRQTCMQDSNQDAEIIVRHEDFTEALQDLTPSLSQVELSRYERLRVQFEGQKALSSATPKQSGPSINDLD
ncbi:hypothetical protein GOP47_0005004 [Adiantum capillus-veneris]|uniref:Peroxisomal ATPase PEX6 n=1 Tax=Adiantum capillus-veneris TaxID=13818 RepID=A0A9D4ZNR7_ADICA|nr:hypothetical protein GOP47_0005004 [Adiantum capillus-veneris]